MSNTLMCWYTETAGIALLVARVVPETDVRAVNIRHAGAPYGRQL